MSFSKNVWDQLKGLDAGTLVSALEKDGWVLDTTCGSIRTYIKESPDGESRRRVQVHYHGDKKGWGRSLLNKILSNIGWTEKEMRDLKLLK